VRRKNGNYLPLRKIIPWKPESVQLTTEYTQNNSLVFEITMFLVYWKAYLNMNLQYVCTHNFSCANKNLLRTISLYFKSFSDQSIYLLPFSPNNSFLLPRSAGDKFTTGLPRSKEYIGKILFSQKGFFVKTIAHQASSQKPITKLYSRLYHADSGAFFSPLSRSWSRSRWLLS